MDIVPRPGQVSISFNEQQALHSSCSNPEDLERGLQNLQDAHTHSSALGSPHAQPTSSNSLALPKVGQTRCYWALLSSSLQFLVLDPVLAYHLQEQSAGFLESSLLDFVHPEERESARQDLGSVLEERTLHGSVTRVRYCRLSRVRRLLGYSEDYPPYPATFPAERIAIDSDYMAVYLVINYVAEGLVLCFMHAVVDIAPQEDNDENHKTGWSNWCSTYGFGEEQTLALYQRLRETVLPDQTSLHRNSHSSLRILQILQNQRDRPLILSWPPDTPFLQSDYVAAPSAQDLARLVQHVRIGYSMGGWGEEDARTSCTRRYRSSQSVRVQLAESTKSVQVESIFIPHGTIIFVCHKIDGWFRNLTSIENNTQMQGLLSSQTHSERQGLPQRRLYGYPSSSNTIQHLHKEPLPAYVRRWVEEKSQISQQNQQACDQDYAHADSLPPLSTSSSHSCFDSDSAGAVYVLDQDECFDKSYSLGDSSGVIADTSYVRDHSPQYASAGGLLASNASSLFSIGAADSENKTPGLFGDANIHDLESTDTVRIGSTRENYSGLGRGAGNPPVGVMRCSSCQITHSPEWRKGSSGKKDLCNACGLRYARSRAKKEGIAIRRKKQGQKNLRMSRFAHQTTVLAGRDEAVASGSGPSVQSFLRSLRLGDSNDSTLLPESHTTPQITYVQSRYLNQSTPTQLSTPTTPPPNSYFLDVRRDIQHHQHVYSSDHSLITANPCYSNEQNRSIQRGINMTRASPTIATDLDNYYESHFVSEEQRVYHRVDTVGGVFDGQMTYAYSSHVDRSCAQKDPA